MGLALLAAGLGLGTPRAAGAEADRRSSPQAAPARLASNQAVPFTRPLLLGSIRAYQKFVAPLRAGRCPMNPSCSAFAYEAFTRHSPFHAYFLTADRLHRCSHDLGHYRPSAADPMRFADPVPSGEPEPPPPTDVAAPRLSSFEQAAAPVDAQDLPPDLRLVRFADDLRTQGSFAEAAVEYQRFLSYYRRSPERARAARSLYETYRQNGELLRSVRWANEMLADPSLLAGQAEDLKLSVGYDLLSLGNGPRARSYFGEALASGDDTQKARATLLTGLAHAADGDWPAAAASFRGLQGPPELRQRAERLERLALEGARLPRRSPALAGALAVVPGLGYLYDGYKQTALASLVVNGLFMAATWKAFDDGNKPLGFVLGFFSLGWYGGNIYGSVSTAHRRNDAIREEHLLKFDLGFRY